MKETTKCSPAKAEVTAGRANCFATGLNLYLCAGLQPQTTYTISAIATTGRSNGTKLMPVHVLGTTVCTTGECGCKYMSYIQEVATLLSALAAMYSFASQSFHNFDAGTFKGTVDIKGYTRALHFTKRSLGYSKQYNKCPV